ncbi:MAG: ABC transporter permease [Pseudomonadales bacterium]|nr:ABC transporter permease [Pseudomonadales bacterium]
MTRSSLSFVQVVWALTIARTKEFYRDRTTMLWALVFPVCVVAAISISFSKDNQEIFKVGIYQPADQATHHFQLTDEVFIGTVEYQDFDKALERIRHHQLDMLFSATQPQRYWINETSTKAHVLEKLLLATADPVFVRETVSGRQIRYVDWVIPGVLGMNVMFGALFGIGLVIVRYRKNGVLKRLQATPITPMHFLTAQVVSRLTVLLIVAVLVYSGCNYFLNFLMLGNYLTLILVAVLGIFSMISLALIVASRIASEELANGLLNFLSFPMMLLSEVWFSLDDAPDWLVSVSNLLPLTHMVKAAREIMINGAGIVAVSHHLWVLAAMSLIFLGVAAFLFRWNEK